MQFQFNPSTYIKLKPDNFDIYGNRVQQSIFQFLCGDIYLIFDIKIEFQAIKL